MQQSLDGVTILDLSRILAGPTATQLLGDLGATVIKVERPGTGDDTRSWGPPHVRDSAGNETDRSAYFLAANRNKRSIAIDLAHPAGQALIRDLIPKADVVVENYKPGDLARYGLDYASLAPLNPRLVWCAISGFGQTGPYADRIGYDFLVQAMGGIMSITGTPDGPPMKVGVGIADVMCGMYAATGILAALRHAERTGTGQMIDLALYDAQVAWLINAATNHLVSGNAPRRLGNRHPNIAPYQTYPAADGHLVVAVGNDTQFARFAAVLGQPDLAADPRFRRNRDRLAHIDALEALIIPALQQASVADWTARLTEAQVPAGPVQDIPTVLSDPHTLSREMVISLPDAGGGSVRLLGNPLKLSQTPVTYDRAPPALDADRQDVLHDLLGLTPAGIDALAAAGAFGPPEG